MSHKGVRQAAGVTVSFVLEQTNYCNFPSIGSANFAAIAFHYGGNKGSVSSVTRPNLPQPEPLLCLYSLFSSLAFLHLCELFFDFMLVVILFLILIACSLWYPNCWFQNKGTCWEITGNFARTVYRPFFHH